MKPKLIERFEGEWVVYYPECIDNVTEEYWDAVEKLDTDPNTAEMELKIIIEKCPYHFDAIIHLGFLFQKYPFRNVEANALIHKAHSIALETIPNDFDENKHKIEWLSLENRPFLRTFHGIILEFMKEQEYEKAISKCEFVLKVNPDDNQGIRDLLMKCFFHKNSPKNVLDLIEEYNDDRSIDFLYGATLAYLQLNKKTEARTALEKAVNRFPKGKKELIKKRHIKPKNEAFLDGIISGSDYQAYDYWKRYGKFWNRTKGGISFLKQNVQK